MVGQKADISMRCYFAAIKCWINCIFKIMAQTNKIIHLCFSILIFELRNIILNIFALHLNHTFLNN